MSLEKYDFRYTSDYTRFEFISIGRKGSIIKVIEYAQISENPSIYNLGFGDKNVLTGEIDDLIVSDNGDSEKVLATVAESVYLFTEHNKKAGVFLTGSTPSRTRLYQMGIRRFLSFIEEDFWVHALNSDTEWESFQKESRYEAFLVIRK